MLANCPLAAFPPDTIMLRADAPVSDIILILGGMVELIDSKTGIHNVESAGAMIGELDGMASESARRTCRALSHVTVLRIPRDMYQEFLGRIGLVEPLRQVQAQRQFLQGTWLFGEMVSFPMQVRLARVMQRRLVREGDLIAPQGKAEVVLLAEGLVTVFLGARSIENLKPGGFFGEETLMRGARELPPGWRQRLARSLAPGAKDTHHLWAIPADAMEDLPVVQWKLMETYERRLKNFRAEVRFEWQASYGVGIPDIDEQHRTLFEMIDDLAAMAEGRESGDSVPGAAEKVVSLARSHLAYEEALAARMAEPGYDVIVREHAEFLKKVEGMRKYLETAPVDALHTMVEQLKDWVIDHTLLEHRRFQASFGS
jgi:hemerythrin